MEYAHTNRVIILVDMDCFYCQVEEKLNPNLVGKPIAVVQYNAWKGGGIIAVNYPAKDKGVTRHMRGNEAKIKCPDIQLVRVPTLREKADLTKYRDAGKEVAAVLQIYADVLERASVDEAYMDITKTVNKRIESGYEITVDQLKNTHIIGSEVKDFVDNFKHEHFLENNLRLCIGGIIAEEIRAAVLKKTGYKCSAGIAHNKILAKLACGLHKPDQQTILPHDGIDGLFETIPLKKIRSLGGKFGCDLSYDLGIKTVGELKKFSEKDLINRYDEKTGSWLYNIARGIDLEPVTVRLVSKSIGCCKKFPGRTALIDSEDVQHWINELSVEISDRLQKDLEENNRKAKQIVVGFIQEVDKKDVSTSRTHPLNSYEPDKIAIDMLKVINKHCLNTYGSYHIKYLGISAGKFEDCKKTYDISAFFRNCDKQTITKNVITEYNLSTSNSKIDHFISNSRFNVNWIDDKTEEKVSKCENETETPSIPELHFKTNNELTNTVASNHCNEQTILNSNYLNNSNLKLPRNNAIDINTTNKSTFTSILTNKNNKLDTNSENDFENGRSSDSDSIYSQTTDTIDINQAELIFNEDYKSIEGFYTSSLMILEDSKCSETDSITDEIEASYEEKHDIPEQNTSSFFSNYFNNREFLNRNFDTSRYLKDYESNFESESSGTDNYEINSDGIADDNSKGLPISNLNKICESPILDRAEYIEENINQNVSIIQVNPCMDTSDNTSPLEHDYNKSTVTTNIKYTKPFEEAFSDNTKERCKECNKLIPIMEMTSHMDYHYAIQIVRGEAHLYNSQNNVSVSNSPKKPVPVKQTKRKRNETISMKLTSYLENNKQISSDIPTEICQHCSKKIPTNEFLSHLDYHVAKELHSEINPVTKSDNKKSTPVLKSSIKRKQLPKQSKNQNVMSFFKQNM